MDTYVIVCSGCQKRFPVIHTTQADQKRYCHVCWREIAKLVKATHREPRGVRVAPMSAEPVADRQRERNKGKPDVMLARIPERKSGWDGVR